MFVYKLLNVLQTELYPNLLQWYCTISLTFNKKKVDIHVYIFFIFYVNLLLEKYEKKINLK